LKKIIDTHLFSWDLNRLDYYWIKNGTASSMPFEWTAEDIKPAVELLLKRFGNNRLLNEACTASTLLL
jgi:predicted TIM-barrel fold metal-dependent hydrolase